MPNTTQAIQPLAALLADLRPHADRVFEIFAAAIDDSKGGQRDGFAQLALLLISEMRMLVLCEEFNSPLELHRVANFIAVKLDSFTGPSLDVLRTSDFENADQAITLLEHILAQFAKHEVGDSADPTDMIYTSTDSDTPDTVH